jgi:RHS repeat-associated protein
VGPLGYGWTHTYDASLDPAFQIEGKEFVKIIDHTGRAHYFLEDGAGFYRGAFKEPTHVKVEAGDYVWYGLDGTRYGFSSSGELIWIEDEKGNRLELTYNGQGRLDTVTDVASSRVLIFYHYGDGLLEYIEGPVTSAVPDGIWVTYGYDVSQNLTSVTYADGSGISYTYADPDDIHNLTQKRDKLGHLLNTWSYDAQDRAVDKFSVNGKGVDTIAYVSETQVDVTDAYGTLRTYILGEAGGRRRVSAIQGPANTPYSESNVVRWAYDDSMRLIEVETAGGTINRYQDYDDRGNPGTVRLAVGTPEERVISYTYHPEMNVALSRTEASVLAGGNKVTIWDYDDDYNTIPNEAPTKLLSQVIEQGFTKGTSGSFIPYEYITALTYNSKGQVLTIDRPLPGSDDTTSFTYDSLTGDLLSITQPLIGSTGFSDYDAAGMVGRLTDVNGQSKGFMYDGRGRVTTITNYADGSSTSIVYDNAGQPDSVTDEDGITRTFDYDGTYGRLITVTDVEGNYIAYAYDTQGNRIEMSKHDSLGARTSRRRWSYEHPEIPGKLWKEINANDSFTEYGYNSEANITSVKDANGNTVYYAYDPLNRLTLVTQPGNITTMYAYDTHANLTSVTDAEAHTTTYEYDDMGRMISTTSPDTGTVTYVYDAVGNPTQKTDAKGVTVQYTYDLLNRLTAAHFPDPSQDITYSYDEGIFGKGRHTGMTDPSGSVAFGYDARGRLVGKTSTILGRGYTMGVSYSPGNRVMTVAYPSGRTLDYTRDSMGRMQGLTTTYNATAVTLVSNMTYNPFGSPKGLSTGAGGEVYNQSGECECVEVANPGEQMERIYTYDNNSNLTDIYGINTPWYNQSFTYDALNRLTSAEGRYGVIGYTYDNVGNRLTRTVNDETENYTYIPGTDKLDQITGANPISFAYDANGNTTGIADKVLIYNQNNRLIRVEEVGSTIAEYTYNGLGQRVTKTVGGATTVFHYDLNGKLIAESLADGTMTAEYLYMGKIRVAEVDISTGKIHYYLNDRLGTPQIMTDDTGTIVWEASYRPFGEASVNPKSTIVNNFRFPGQYCDPETGLHYNYHRYYDPRTGRYLRADPIGFTGGLNLFAYVGNNPITGTDPLGLYSQQAIANVIRYNPGALPALLALGEAAIIVGKGTLIAGVGVGAYYLTSKAIEDTWLGRGELGEILYEITHRRPDPYDIETAKRNIKNITAPPIREVQSCEPPPGPENDCITGCRKKFQTEFIMRQICILGCILAAF